MRIFNRMLYLKFHGKYINENFVLLYVYLIYIYIYIYSVINEVWNLFFFNYCLFIYYHKICTH